MPVKSRNLVHDVRIMALREFSFEKPINEPAVASRFHDFKCSAQLMESVHREVEAPLENTLHCCDQFAMVSGIGKVNEEGVHYLSRMSVSRFCGGKVPTLRLDFTERREFLRDMIYVS
jgi:hypothetical protein